jgi:NADH:ubiquinone oxidoreductase subunit D
MSSIKRLYTQYFDKFFNSLDEFIDFFDKNTKDYTSLVIYNNIKSDKIEDILFLYKTPFLNNDCKDSLLNKPNSIITWNVK